MILLVLISICTAAKPELRPWREGKIFLNATNYNRYMKTAKRTLDLRDTLGGCCSWDGKTCGQTTDYCNESQDHCEKDCSGKWINGGGGGGITCGDRCANPTDGKCNGCADCSWCWPTGSSPSDPAAACQCPNNPGPSPSGQASTTRYWDCNQPFCEPGNLPYPHSYRPFKMPDGRIFAHAAASDAILQGHAACEKCYQAQYNGVTFVLKVDNWCPCSANPGPGGCCEPHFDIAVPGTDYGPASASNVCQQSDPSMRYDKGRQSCSHWPWEDGPDCCNSVSTDEQLNEACRLFVGIGWNNPRVGYAEVSCPY